MSPVARPRRLAWQEWIGCIACLAAAAWVTASLRGQETEEPPPEPDRVFEMRTYVTHEGKLEALHQRFRDHTCKLFEKHGMTNIGYWTPAEGEEAKNTLVYILAYPSREAREKSWEAFRNDPEWQAVQQESEKNGPLVNQVISQFLNPTNFSAIR